MDKKLLEKFFRKECSEEEVRRILKWFEKESASNENFWQEEWKNAIPKPSDSIHSSSLLENIHATLDTSTPPPSKKISKSRLIYRAKIAAAMALLVSFTFLIDQLVNLSEEAESQLSLDETTVVRENPRGVKQTFFLNDSSRVYLNSDSKLTYPERFDKNTRELSLTGEAYFEVKKNPEKPFMVKTGELTTTVLGTSFNVNSFEDENKITVSLTEGKVQIDYKNNPEHRLILLPGEQVTLDKKSGKIQKSTFDPNEILAWKNNTLHFKNASLDEVVKKLERWYGVQIEIDGKIDTKWNYSGEFANESLRTVLNGISYVKDFNFKLEGKNVKIYLK